MRKLIFLLIITILSFNTFAQSEKKERQAEKRERVDSLIKQEEEGVIVYRKNFSFGLKLVNDGYGVFFEWGRAKSVKKSLLYQFEISEQKSNNQVKTEGYFANTNAYIYGKENFFYPVKLGLQQQTLLGNKSNKNGVSVTANYGGGVTAGLLRPYFIQVQQGNGLGFIKYNSADSADFLNEPIYGGPGLGQGWNDLSVVPGLYAKAALRFDYGKYNEVISAIEIGISEDYYTQKIAIMVDNPAKQFFFSGYVAILFGKRK